MDDVDKSPVSAKPFVSSEEQLNLLMNSVTDYAIFFADPQAKIVTWNSGAENILGWTEAEIIGQPVLIIYTPEDRASGNAQREIDSAAADGRAEDERWHMRKNGSRFWGSGIVTALRDEAGALRGFCKIMRDLTERKKWEDDLKVALNKQGRITDALQTSLLMVPPPDTFPGITVKPLYEAASSDLLIGGDVFDWYALEHDKIALVVGDATGKGLEAAIFTAEVKFALRAFLREDPSPATALQRLNVFLTEKERLDPTHIGGSYMAMAVCVVNTKVNDLVCSWAGIEPPFVLRVRTGEIVPLWDSSGPLLGVEASSDYREQYIALEVGDVLAMTTDGLTEARSRASREFFGYDGLTQAVREEVARNPASLADAGLAVAVRARAFAGGVINDDICLLLARCLAQ